TGSQEQLGNPFHISSLKQKHTLNYLRPKPPVKWLGFRGDMAVFFYTRPYTLNIKQFQGSCTSRLVCPGEQHATVRSLSRKHTDALLGSLLQRNTTDRCFCQLFNFRLRFSRAIPMGRDKTALVIEHLLIIVPGIHRGNPAVPKFSCLLKELLLNS